MTKVLVIDDEEHIRLKILEILEYEGFETISAENGRIGVQLAKTYLPDLVLCDVVMPELSGYGVLFQLRSNPLSATIPFIFLTARTAMSDRREGMNLGADDYLTKPFQIDDLLSAIHIRLEKHSAISEQASKQLEDLRLDLSRTLPHELRTPLQEMFGASDLLIEFGPNMLQESNENDIVEIGEIIRASTLRLQQLVENYLLYADLRLMEYDPERRRQEMWQSDEFMKTEHLIRAVATHKAKESQRQDDLMLELVDAEIRISERSLQKIIAELLDNAFKFSEAGTSVRISTRIEGEHFLLSFTDRGCGMTREQIANIGAYMQFERHWHEQQGIGLGLILACILAQLHSAELTIDSEVNQGTTVTVVFNRDSHMSNMYSEAK